MRLFLTFTVLIGLFSATVTHAAPRDETLVLYGGFGHLGNSAQPVLGKILFDRDANTTALRTELESSVAKAIRLERYAVSSHPIAFTDTDIRNALAQRLGAAPSRITLEDLTDAFTRIYVLVLAAGLEHRVVVPYRTRQIDASDAHFIVAVSAMLVELGGDVGESRVILSSTTLGEEILTDQTSGTPVRAQHRHFATAYRNAAEDAVANLARLSRTIDPASIEDYSDRSMITGVFIDDEASRRLFGFQAQTDPVTSCRVSSQCAADPANCNLLSSFIAHKATETLGKHGRLMVPPLRWAQWGYLATERSAVTMRLSRGPSVVEDTLQINVSDRAVDEKVTAVLSGLFALDKEVAGTNKLFHRNHFASNQFCFYQTKPLDTAAVTRQSLSAPFRNIGSPVIEMRVKGETAAPRDVEQAYKLISLWNAYEGFK